MPRFSTLAAKAELPLPGRGVEERAGNVRRIARRSRPGATPPTTARCMFVGAKWRAMNARMAWGVPQVSSWYKNARGRVSQNWPFPLVDYWKATTTPNANDFTFEKRAS